MENQHSVKTIAEDGKPLIDPNCLCGKLQPCPEHWADENRPEQLTLEIPNVTN